jgi:uncharacterized repeat protein (TIGR02059 family)
MNKFLPKTISFTTAIPFDQPVTYLGEYTLTGPIAFTINPAGAQPSFGAILRLVSDGTNVPNFSAFKSIGTGSWSNTAAAVNTLWWVFDGVDYCLSITQPVVIAGGGGGGDLTAPVLQTANVADATPSRIDLTYNENLDTGSVPSAGNFGVLVDGVASNPVVSIAIVGMQVRVTLTDPITAGQVILISYTGGTNKIQDVAGNDAAIFSNQPVTNSVGGSGLVDLTPTGSGITETSTHVWHSGATDNNWIHRAKDDVLSLAGVGGIQVKYPAGSETDGSTNRETFFGLHTSNVLAGGYGSTPLMAASVRIHDASVLEWGLAGTRTDMGSPAVVDRYYRLYRDSGNDVYLQESTTGLPGSWGNLQLVGNITGTLYAVFDFFGNASKGFITEPKGEGFA